MVGIKDVANRAGVSLSTVSYVMTGKRPISPATRQRVLAAARAVGYLPDGGVARSHKTRFVALSSPVHDSTSFTSYSAYFLYLLRQLRARNYEVLLLTEENGKEQLQRLIDTGLVDGVILLDVNSDDERVHLASTTNIPFLSVGIPRNPEGMPCIDTDFELLGKDLVNKLNNLGHRKLMFIGGSHADYERSGGANYLVRLRSSIRAASRNLGVELSEQYVDEADFDTASLILDLAVSNGTTALILQVGPLFIGNLAAACRKNGISIPEDMSIVSAGTFNDQICRRLRIDEYPLDPVDLCRMGADMMVRMIADETWKCPSMTLVPALYHSWGSISQPPTNISI